jgi:hypothetical protein
MEENKAEGETEMTRPSPITASPTRGPGQTIYVTPYTVRFVVPVTSRDLVPIKGITSALAGASNRTRNRCRERRGAPRLGQGVRNGISRKTVQRGPGPRYEVEMVGPGPCRPNQIGQGGEPCCRRESRAAGDRQGVGAEKSALAPSGMKEAYETHR